MAHKIKIKVVPFIKADGTPSTTKKYYEVWDQTRGRNINIGGATSQKAAESVIENYRTELWYVHRALHPNDEMYVRKHEGGKLGGGTFATQKAVRPDRSRGWRDRIGDKWLARGAS